MGQKVNPQGLRFGVIKDWDSRWYSETNSKKVQCCGLRVGQVKPWNTRKHPKSQKSVKSFSRKHLSTN